MGARVIFESLRRRWRGKLIGLLAVACGIAILAALLALATDGGDKLASDVRGYGANLLVRPDEPGATIDLGSLPALKTIHWRNNIGAFAPDLTATVESDGGRFVLWGTWFDHAMPQPDAPDWRTGSVYLDPSWASPDVLDGDLPREDAAEIALGARLAGARGWRVGQDVTVSRGDSRATLRVVGILRTGEAWDERALAPIAVVESILGVSGASSVRVSAVAKPDDELARRNPATLSMADRERLACSPYLSTVAAELAGSIPGTSVAPVTAVSEAESLYRSRLEQVLALLALAAAALTALGVHGTVRGALLERQPEIGLMRALGARSGHVAALLAGEGLAIGVAGALIGAVLGHAGASWLSLAAFGAPLPFRIELVPLLVIAGALLSAAGTALALRRLLRRDALALLLARAG